MSESMDLWTGNCIKGAVDNSRWVEKRWMQGWWVDGWMDGWSRRYIRG